MTDLSKGIIDFCDVVLTPNTTKDDLIQVYGSALSPSSTTCFLDFNMLFLIDGYKFMCFFTFDGKGNLSTIQMRPCINYKSEKSDRTGRQEERRAFCDKWLHEQLGEPQRNLGGAEYIFDGLRISTVTHFDQHNGADAGYIVITYLR